MTATSALFILLVGWILIGAIGAIAMARRGHSPHSWAYVGLILGPLVAPLMISEAHRERAAPVGQARPPSTRSGDLDILVGLDGSDEATGALVQSIALFGTRIGRLTIATVIDYEGGSSKVAAEEQARARELLSRPSLLAAGLLDREPDTVVLTGQPADALVRHARDGEYDLLVVAPRGKGASRLLFGSVASRLARGVDVPIAILPPAVRRNGVGD